MEPPFLCSLDCLDEVGSENVSRKSGELLEFPAISGPLGFPLVILTQFEHHPSAEVLEFPAGLKSTTSTKPRHHENTDNQTPR